MDLFQVLRFDRICYLILSQLIVSEIILSGNEVIFLIKHEF